MFRGLRVVGLIAAVAIVALMAQRWVHAQRTSDATSRIIGSWRILSYELEFQDGSDSRLTLGPHPNGYLIFGADGRMMAYLEGDGRKSPKTDGERAAAFQAMIAYTGRYRVQGNTWTTKVDGAWNFEWTGTEQQRFFTLDGDRLSVVAQWNRNPFYDGRMTRGHLTFEREKKTF